MTEIDDVLDEDHDCRERIKSGHADHVDTYRDTPRGRQLVYECDRCGRTLYEIVTVHNVQVGQKDDEDWEYSGAIAETAPDEDDLYSGELHPLQ